MKNGLMRAMKYYHNNAIPGDMQLVCCCHWELVQMISVVFFRGVWSSDDEDVGVNLQSTVVGGGGDIELKR